MSNALTVTAPNQITFLPDTSKHRFRFEIPSSDGSDTYVISQAISTGQWQCGCPSWIYQRGPMLDRKPCKHLRSLTDILLQLDATGHAMASLDASSKPIHPASREARALDAAEAKAKKAPRAIPAPKAVPAIAPAAAPAAAPVAASGRDAARQAIDALVRDAEAEVALLRGQLQVAEAKLAALLAAAKVA